ncbi:uncharacterized protein [Nicotiana sylvestris]|uniref:uncharacterized protein n=1 Tax=Nicotiana sylvestris TaxID=4096 RepID=UPI00388CEAED
MDPNEKLGGHPHRMYKSLEFQTCINNCGLIDIGYNGSNFTWCNNRSPRKRIWKKLDRIFVNDLWDQLFQRSSFRHLARTGSDHRPLLMKNLSSTHQHISYFRFLNWWVNIEGFYDIVKESWSTEVTGNPMWILQSKLKTLSKRLSQWSRKEIGDINDAVINWEDKLQELVDVDIEENSKKSREEVNRAHAQYIKWLNLQESMIKQKAQIKWFKEGDKNTNYFHSILG